MSNRLVLWVGGVVAVLLIMVVVVGVVLVNTINAQAADQRYADCMAAHGYERGVQPEGVTDDTLDAYVSGAAEAAEFCSVR